MSSPKPEIEEATSSNDVAKPEAVDSTAEAAESSTSVEPRPPAKRPLQTAVIEISDTDSDDSDICAVTSYQASADEVKRIRGADYSSSSSSSSDSYSSDSESPWEDDSILLEDERPVSKVLRTQLFPRANRTEDPQLNSTLKSQELIDRLTTHWKEMKDLDTEEVTLTCEPFRLCLLHDLLSNDAIINNIVDDMNTLDWTRKKMDLYEFHQTVDLANLTWQRSIKGIYELLKTEVMSWLSAVTGLQLSSVSASCSLYGPGDHLLAHDDMCGDRRIAFILYLAPWRPPLPSPASAMHNGGGDHAEIEQVELAGRGWAARMGGALQLFARDEAGQPTSVVHSVYPNNNMLAFFRVGPETFHQVGEVLSLEVPRLSINGWFHGPAPPGPDAPIAPETPDAPDDEQAPTPLPSPQRFHNDVVLMAQWIDAAYMSPVSRAGVQAQMERESEVCLRAFLQPERAGELLTALAADDVEWEAAGPANRRQYHRVSSACADALPRSHPVRAVLALATSQQWARLLHDCTDLKLAGCARAELQRYRAGDYTLLPARSAYAAARLEALLYLGVPERALCGGHTTFLAPEEPDAGGGGGEALVTVPAQHNALSLVYCDAGAAGFTKYLSKLSMPPHECFYILSCSYTE